MPVLAMNGSVQRADSTVIVELFQFTPSRDVSEDAAETIVIPQSSSAAVGFGTIASASCVYLTSDRQLSIALTITGNVTLTAFKARHLVIDMTEVIGMTLTNLDSSNAAKVRVVLGGA